MKKIISLSLVVILAIMLSVAVFASTPKFVDNDSIVSAEDYNRLLNYMESKSDALDFTISALLMDSIGGSDIQDYADLYYENNFVADSNGILFLLVLDTREWCFSTSGTGIGIFNDDDLEYMSDAILPYLREGKYAEAVEQYVRMVESTVDYVNQYGSDVTEDGYMIKDPESEPQEKSLFSGMRLAVCGLLGLATGGISVSSMKSKLNTVHKKYAASDYIRRNSLVLNRANDLFVTKTVSKTRKATNNNGRSGGSYHSGGSTHISSSGHSHGGSHGHF